MVAKAFSNDPILDGGQSAFFMFTRCDTASERLVKIVFADNLMATPDGFFALFIATDYSFNLREEKNTQNMPLFP